MLKYQITIGLLCFALGVTAVIAIQNFRNTKGHNTATEGKLFSGGEPGEIRQREDDNFVYYDVVIKDLVNQKLDIRVEGGQITVSGTIEKKSSDKGDKGSSSQFYSSTFHRSYPVSYGVDETKAQMEQDGEKIIIKLPKIKLPKIK